MTEREWMKEGLDLKLPVLLYRRKIWISLAGALAGGLLAGGLYMILHVLYAPAREYEAESKVYLTLLPTTTEMRINIITGIPGMI